MSYLPNISTGNTLWVDAINGNDSTGLRGKEDTPFLTILAAIAASSPGDLISVRPGTYPETNTLDITGLSLVSTGGWENTTIGDGSVTAYDVIQVGDQGYIQGFSVLVPNSVQAAIECNQVSGTNSVYDVAFYGTGTTGPGTGINRTGGGKTIGANIRVEGGGMANALRVDSGVLALEGVHVPQSAGTIDNVLLCTVNVGPTTGGRAQMFGFNTGSTNVTNAIRTEGGVIGLTDNPTALIFTPNIFNATNALSTDGVYQTTNLLGGRIENVTYAVNVDLAATGAGLESSIYRISSNHQPKYLYLPEVAAKSEITLNYTQEPTAEFDSSFNIFGANQISAGIPEKGVETSFGKGAPYTTGLVAYTATGVAAGSDGTFGADITSDVISKDGSTFTFPAGVDSAIYVGAYRFGWDGSDIPLKFWGLEAVINTAATGSIGDYIFEIWDGAAWTMVSCMATEADSGIPYGADIFRRGTPASPAEEFYRIGADSVRAYEPIGDGKFADITWTSKSLGAGFPALALAPIYWLRIRTTVDVVTAGTEPDFENFKLIDSTFNISKNGIPSGIGLGMFRKTIFLSGRIWSSNIAGMGLVDLGNYEEVVGNTALGGDNWNHEINYAQMEEGDEINVQFPIPIGTCTAFPIKIKCVFNFDEPTTTATTLGADNMVLTSHVMPQATANNLIADSTGGKALVKRDLSDADFLSVAGRANVNQTDITINGSNGNIEGTTGSTNWIDLENKVYEIEMSEIDISNYYENDLILMNIAYTTDPAGMDPMFVTPFSLIIEGVFHQDGAGL